MNRLPRQTLRNFTDTDTLYLQFRNVGESGYAGADDLRKRSATSKSDVDSRFAGANQRPVRCDGRNRARLADDYCCRLVRPLRVAPGVVPVKNASFFLSIITKSNVSVLGAPPVSTLHVAAPVPSAFTS